MSNTDIEIEKLDEILLRLQNGNITYPEAKSALKQLINKEKAKARIEQIDELIDLEPEKQFMHWKPHDIANFFNRVGRIRRKLEAQLAKDKEDENG